MTFYANINSKSDIVGIDLCTIIKDEYGSNNVQNIETTEEVYNNAQQYGINYYIFKNNKIIPNPNYEEEKQAEEDAEFNKLFFNTSLGYVSRTVHMLDGSTCKFLTDILPLLVVGTPVLVYTRELEQSKVLVTEEFLLECKQQLLIDFYGANNND